MVKAEDRDLWERPPSVPPDQEWFWTPEWLAGEREAGAQIAAGGGKVFSSTEEFLAYLEHGAETAAEESRPSGQ